MEQSGVSVSSGQDERAQIAAAMAEGRFAEAIEALQAQVRARPRDPGPLAELGDCLWAARRPEAALKAFRAALALAPGNSDLRCAVARVLHSLGRTDEAARVYELVLARDSASFPAGFGLALLSCETGEWAKVEKIAELMAAHHGARPDLEWLTARAELGQGRAEAALDRLDRLLASSGLGPVQRADVLLVRSDALDQLDRPAEAFASAVEGKQIQRRIYAERAAGREGHVERLQRLVRWFEAADPEPWRSAPAASPAQAQDPKLHVFILGFLRSGTTLLEQALAGHPGVAALEEAPTLAEPYAQFMASEEGLGQLARLGEADAEVWRARYWQEVRAQGVDPAGKVFVDKAPAETASLPLIAKLFPSARILFAVRDPRDVVLSCLRRDFQMNALTFALTELREAAACYGACMALAEVYRRMLPLNLLEVRHEALAEDFAGQMERVAAFLELEAMPKPADPAVTARGRRVRTPSADQVRAGLNRRGVGRWRAYAAELAPVLPMLEPWVKRFGYEAD
jgi:tetratricopeptide (TPR) repeat protein